MDEQDKKINVGSFFERNDSIDKVASAALPNSNPAIATIGANKLLIESLQTSIEAMQTQIRNIANYIVIEHKLQRDEREDRLLEEQDAKQKQEMKERALGLQGAKGLMGDKGAKGQPGEFGQEGGGGSFLGGLFKALATGATLIGAAKLLGPVLLPMLTKGIFTKLIPALGKGLTLGFGKLGGVIVKGLSGSLGKLPIIGKAIAGLGSKLIGGIGSVAKTILGSIATAIGFGALTGGSVKASESNMSFESGEKGGSDEGLSGGSAKGGLTGSSVKASESNMSFRSDEEGGNDEGLVESDKFTMKSSATLKKGKVVSGDMSQEDAERNIKKLKLQDEEFDAIQSYGFNSPEHNEIKKKMMILNGVPEEAIYTDKEGKLRTKGYSTYGGETTVSDDTKKKPRSMASRLLGGIDALSGNLLDLDRKGGETFGGGRVLGGVLDAVTGNRFDFDKKNDSVQADDLTFKNINQLKSSVANNSAAIQSITSPSSLNGGRTNSPVLVQNSKPQVTYTEIKTTNPAIPFINTLGNQYLSLSPHTNKLPPEIARMIQ